MTIRDRAPDQLPPPPWQRRPRPASRRRRDPITVDAIVETALRLLDSDGLDRLSMRRVADELDTGAASLYWHVGSKDGLLDLIFDRVIGEHEMPEPQGARWKEQIKEVARAQRQAILRHRDLIAVSLGRVPMGPNALRFSEGVLAILRAGGVPDRLAVTGHLLLIATVNGFTLDEVSGPRPDDAQPDDPQPDDPQRGGKEASAPPSADAVAGYLASLPADQFPNLSAVARYFGDDDPDQRFDLLIDLFVEGLAQRAALAAPPR